MEYLVPRISSILLLRTKKKYITIKLFFFTLLINDNFIS